MSENLDHISGRTIKVAWTSDDVNMADRVIEVTDNASGMTLEQLQNAVRAGYTSNDPVGTLGLFGMGFNIATARLGECTRILSSRKGDSEWIGIEIDFQKLIESGSFEAPIVREHKDNDSDSGTRISIAQLHPSTLNELSSKKNEIRRQLEIVYAPLLKMQGVSITLQGIKLHPHKHCVWSETRYVQHGNDTVPAVLRIDESLGKALFDKDRNCYLTESETDKYEIARDNGEPLPKNIIERDRRITGWLGIQRYADPDDYGIDFIRNGRKILLSDKSFFYYFNPTTLQNELQYPLELGTSIGGRIVGELNVNFLLPTYQKNGFNKSDMSWQKMQEVICGTGPFRQKSRKALGFTKPNQSPLCRLVNAYNRIDKGTRCLFVPNNLSKKYASEFEKGSPEYLEDTKWWKAAQEADQERGMGKKDTPTNTGDVPTDDIESYLGGGTDTGGATSDFGTTSSGNEDTATDKDSHEGTHANETSEDSSLDDLLSRSSVVEQLSGKLYPFGNRPSLNVRARVLDNGKIMRGGKRVPCFFRSMGIDCDFVYDKMHPLLTSYPFTPKMLLLVYMAEKLKARDALPDMVAVLSELVSVSMEDSKIDKQSLAERANSTLEYIRERMIEVLKDRPREVVSCIHESSGDVEVTANSILKSGNTALFKKFQNRDEDAFDAMEYVPFKTLYRLVDKFPESLFDGKVFSAPYSDICIGDANTTARMREDSKERILACIKEAENATTYVLELSKEELTRMSLSVDVLSRELRP